ncbi:unnamed protein product [Miscanthus lutarioriparius]|uniref:COX assembly mitochondrial protein n=1 Tax=Miscanthus lutarioriparius TaxID=422564 RepID=A0A811MAY6_9POAL|nr:unnamed protein product [Miscanthus lutarioriparius]
MGYLQEARENHVKKKVEEALRSKMKQKALKECDFYCSKYAECARGRTFSVVFPLFNSRIVFGYEQQHVSFSYS